MKMNQHFPGFRSKCDSPSQRILRPITLPGNINLTRGSIFRIRQNIILYLKYDDPSSLRVCVPSLMDGHWSKEFVGKILINFQR